MLASSAPSARTGSAHQGLTKFSNCTGNEHYVSVLLIAPNLKKKDIKTCFNCSIKRGSTLVLIPEHNLIPNESELAQIAANVFLFFKCIHLFISNSWTCWPISALSLLNRAAINNNQARAQHRETCSLLFARSAWVH